MPNYDYRCPDGHQFEARGGYETAGLPCRECGEVAVRLAVYAVAHVVAGAVSVPLDQRRVNLSKFMEAAHGVEHEHKKQEEIHQKTLDNPNYFHEGIRRANEVLAGRRAPPKEF